MLIFKDGQKLAVRKRPGKGLLAGLYEFPNLTGHLSMDEVTAYSKEIGLAPIRIRPLEKAKHIFSHIEWHMTAQIVEAARRSCRRVVWADRAALERDYAVPNAFQAFAGAVEARL